MKIEKIITRTVGKSVNISANAVDSLRINNSVKNTVRIYENGLIGVAGQIGETDFDKLEKKARENLSLNVPYPESHEEKKERVVDICKDIIPPEKVVSEIKDLVAKLAEQNPRFTYSNKVNLEYIEREYSNSDGVNYKYKSNYIAFGIIAKDKQKSNIFDYAIGGSDNLFDKEKILADAKLTGDNFLIDADFEFPEEIPVILDASAVAYIVKDVAARYYCERASMFNGKLGSKIFNEKVTILSDRSPDEVIGTPFFDAEGVVAEDDKKYLIKDGVFCGLGGNKKEAELYKVDCEGFASSSYDGVPASSLDDVGLKITDENTEDILKGKQAIFISQTGGGDMTATGDMALPVQLAFLYKDGKLCGRVKDFTLVGNIFDLLGKNFLGCAKKSVYSWGRTKYLVAVGKPNL